MKNLETPGKNGRVNRSAPSLNKVDLFIFILLILGEQHSPELLFRNKQPQLIQICESTYC